MSLNLLMLRFPLRSSTFTFHNLPLRLLFLSILFCDFWFEDLSRSSLYIGISFDVFIRNSASAEDLVSAAPTIRQASVAFRRVPFLAALCLAFNIWHFRTLGISGPSFFFRRLPFHQPSFHIHNSLSILTFPTTLHSTFDVSAISTIKFTHLRPDDHPTDSAETFLS